MNFKNILEKLQSIVTLYLGICMTLIFSSYFFIETYMMPIFFTGFTFGMGIEIFIEFKLRNESIKNYFVKSGLWFAYPAFILIAVVLWLAWLNANI